MYIIDGQKIASKITESIKEKISNFINKRKPSLMFIKVGKNNESSIYLKKKSEKAKEIGIESRLLELPEETTELKLLNIIDCLNNDKTLDAILVQLPLPIHINPLTVFSKINYLKDVDGFNPINIGKICQEDSSGFIPCTPLAILEVFKNEKIKTEGKYIVILGRSLIVGRTLALLLLQKKNTGNATVTVCHSKTKYLSKYTTKADILIVAVGIKKFINSKMIKKNAVVIDVGINHIVDNSKIKKYKIEGDTFFKDVAPKASFITPVPGGIGPITVAMLMKNTLKAYYNNENKLSK